jgi:hypothetical protein
MRKNISLDFHVGQCGGCELKVRFWPSDGARLTCPNCGVAHEVEVDAALDLTTKERIEVGDAGAHLAR